PGNYTLTVSGASGDVVTPYAFRLLDTAAAVPLTPGSAVTGRLSPGSETDLYTFTANAGDRFAFTMQSITNFQGVWRLTDPYGDEVFVTGFFNSVLEPSERTLPNTGTYVLSLEGSPSLSGTSTDFTFKVDFHGNTPPLP